MTKKMNEGSGVEVGGEESGGILTYSSNNSGGYWWLTDENWKALEDAGWTVHWLVLAKTSYGNITESGRRYSDHLAPREVGPLYPDDPTSDREALEVANTYDEAVALADRHGRYMSALAVSAAKATDDPNATVAEWEQLTGQDAGAEGCNCCGEPHSFEFIDAQGKTHYAGIEVTSTFKGFAAKEQA